MSSRNGSSFVRRGGRGGPKVNSERMRVTPRFLPDCYVARAGLTQRRRLPGPERTRRAGVYTEAAMPLKLTLPADLDLRLAGLGDAIAAASDDVVFAYLSGSTANGN